MAEEPQKEGVGELGFESSAFETLEHDFQEVLTELVGDKSLERFRQEYEKLHRALKKSHDSEKRLIKKCRELNSEIVSNAAKVQTALKLSQEDQNTIASLKREIEKAWKMVDASHEKEARAKETISQLKSEISNLSRLVEQGAGLSMGQESQVNDLLKDKDDLMAERDAQVEMIARLRAEVGDYLTAARAKEQERGGAADEIQSLKEVIASRRQEADRDLRRRERLEKESKDTKHMLESRAQTLRSRTAQLSQSEANERRVSDSLGRQKGATDRALRDLEIARSRLASQDSMLQEQKHARQLQLGDNAEISAALKAKDDEIQAMRHAAQQQLKRKELEIKRLKVSEDQALELEAIHSNFLGQAAQLEREIEVERREHEAEARNAAEVQREIAEIARNIGSTNDLTQRQVDIVRLNATMTRQLETEIGMFKSESMKQRKIVHHLEKERERFGAEASDANAKFVAALEEVKLREMTILDLQKKIFEGEARLKQQQNLYEAVRSDRNLYSKNLIESQDEIAEMKRKFKIMNHQIEQLKEEIDAKDQAFVKEHIEHSKADKEKDALKNHLMHVRKGVASAEITIKNFEAEVGKLNHIISEADAERFRQKREYDVVINERDILGTQLIRRNDELALLAEKLKVQQMTISNGEMEYRERLEDVRVLKLRSNAVRRDLSIHKSQSSNLEGLRADVYSLQRELLQDRTKVKALSEELENPNNAHRWRKLEGSDPGTYEMLQKIQALQKRLISKTEEVVEKDLMIQEKDKLYVELKNILARQPGPEVAEQLSVFQQGLRDRTKSMKAMASELNMYQAQINESKYQMERVTRDLQDVKRKYYEQKRRETLTKERERVQLSEREQGQLTVQSM